MQEKSNIIYIYMHIHIKPVDTVGFFNEQTTVIIYLYMHILYRTNITPLLHFDYTGISKHMIEV